MKVVAFLTDHAVVDRNIHHPKLTFAAERPPPSRIFAQVALPEVAGFEDFRSRIFLRGAGRPVLVWPHFGLIRTINRPRAQDLEFLTPAHGWTILLP